ncbi:unnamed protein product [Leptosia nina]|uniref:Uncharacterized protein n=1 Tax=Leptosia nina TaxID=320188 RepID=A0AAV1JRD9_9NEOP
MNSRSSVASNSLSNFSLIESSPNTSARLRRLKIQEDILTAAANKILLNCESEERENADLKNYVSKVKRSYSEIKTLFQDIKTLTGDQDNLKNTDIDDIKKDILELEAKVTNFKNFLRRELTVLRVAEKELIQQINDNPQEIKSGLVKAQTKPYSELVPSPVRVLIHSPLKSVEVQRFQEFLKTTKRFGGWNEYNHNSFVSVWNKYYKQDNNLHTPYKDDATYLRFSNEVCQKIFGIKPDEIWSHTQWYLEYVHLKSCQEEALSKWKDNKRKIKYSKQKKVENTEEKSKTREQRVQVKFR